MSAEARASFAQFLAIADPSDDGRRARAVVALGLVDLRARWRNALGPGSTREDVRRLLGAPDQDDGLSLVYQLGDRPGFGYAFVFGAGDALTWKGYRRLGPPREAPPRASVAGGVTADAHAGLTEEEARRWWGAPLAWRAWWPVAQGSWTPSAVMAGAGEGAGAEPSVPSPSPSSSPSSSRSPVTLTFVHGVVLARPCPFPSPVLACARVFQVDPGFATLTWNTQSGSFFVALGRESEDGAPMKQRLAATWAAAHAAGSRAPEELDERFLQALLAQTQDAHLSFVALHADVDHVTGCLAGPLRVHALEQGRLAHVAREADARYAAVSFHWPVTGPYRLLIASSGYHAGAPPSEYALSWARALDEGRLPSPAADSHAGGLLAELSLD